MLWFKHAITDESLAKHNIKRCQKLIQKIERIKELSFAIQSGSYFLLKNLVDDKLIESDAKLKGRLAFLLEGENNQKIVLDNPRKAIGILDEMIEIINWRIRKEQKRTGNVDQEGIV